MVISVIKGSVVEQDTDAIVNAANCSLLGGGGVDGAIHRAAGPKLLEECRTLGGCQTGDAKITKGYNLKAKYVIHTVGPVYSGKPKDADLLASCYRRCMDLALEKKCKSISFCCVSTGVYGYPLQEASEIAVKTVREWLKGHQDAKIDVVFCCFNDREYEVYKSILMTEKAREALLSAARTVYDDYDFLIAVRSMIKTDENAQIVIDYIKEKHPDTSNSYSLCHSCKKPS